MSQIYLFKIPKDLSPDTFHSLLPFLSDFHQDKIHAQDNWNTLEAIFYADVLMRTVLCKHFNINNEDLIVRKNIFGVPFVYNKDRFFIDLALNGQWVVCCTRPKGPISAYVQEVDPALKPLLLGEVSDAEIKAISQNGRPPEIKLLAQYVAIKNSIFKLYTGNCFYDYRYFTPPYQTKGQFELIDVHYHFYQADAMTLIALMQEGEPVDLDLEIYSKTELLNDFRQLVKKKR